MDPRGLLDETITRPATTGLGSIHPNPFNPQTTIEYSLRSPGQVSIAIYDTRGARVRDLLDGPADAGDGRVVWNGRDNRGQTVTSGIYFVRMTAGRMTDTRKIVLLK